MFPDSTTAMALTQEVFRLISVEDQTDLAPCALCQPYLASRNPSWTEGW